MTRSDLRLLAFLIAATLLSIPLAGMAAGPSGGFATIYGPTGETSVDLGTEAEYVVEGRQGEIVFVVEAGELICTASSCDAQVCVKLHRVSDGRPVVCAPNGVSAMLALDGPEGDGEGGYDAVSR